MEGVGFIWVGIGLVCICNILYWMEIFNHFSGDDEEEE